MSASHPSAISPNPSAPTSRRKAKTPAPSSGSSAGFLPDTHRQLPQSIDAEKGVLCSILLEPLEVLTECIGRIDENHFYHPAHATLFQILVELWKDNIPIDIVSVTQTLSDRNLLDQVGGPGFIADLFTFLPTAANADYYVEIIREKYLLRQVITVCTEYAARSYEEQGDARVLLDEVEARVLSIGQERIRDAVPDMKQQVMQAVDSIEKLYRSKGELSGLPTGFSKLDQMTSGLHPGEMFVIAARPSMGKTALAMNIAEHVAIDRGKAVGVFSLEMSSQQLVQRLLCSRARVNLARVRDGFLSKHDFPNITAAADKLANAKMYIDDTAGLSVLDLRAKCRRMRDRYGIELVVIDYLQLLRSTSRRAQDNRQIEIAEISNGVKALSKELNIPIIVLAQLNRQPDNREGGKPRLSDLRESGSIEQDADIVGLLVRSAYYEKDEEGREERGGEAELIIAKQRNGPVGEIPLTFLREFTRFEDRAEHRDEERG